jgi:hypothetical protein
MQAHEIPRKRAEKLAMREPEVIIRIVERLKC